MKPSDTALIAALTEDLREAWQKIHTDDPTERVYAFGVYTCPEVLYLMPFACGENGLRKVAEKYVAKDIYSNVSDSMQSLRWSIADSPYGETFSYDRTDEALRERPDPVGDDLEGPALARELRSRYNAAVAALKTLDREGLFGTGEARAKIVLLIEMGDREEEFALKWAQKLNPPEVFQAYKALSDTPTVGRWSEFGTKKVYATVGLAVSEDHRLVVTAGDYLGCVFDVVAKKQLLCRPIPKPRDYRPTWGVAMSRDGSTLAFVAGSDQKTALLTILDGPGWKRQRDYPLPCQPISIACAPDAAWFAVGTTNNLAHIVSNGGAMLARIDVHRAWIRSVATSPDGSLLATIDEKSGTRLWRTSDWTEQLHIPDAIGSDVSFDPSGRHLTTAFGGGSIKELPENEILRVWDLATGKQLQELRVDGFYIDVARFAPDGKSIACSVTSTESISHTEAVLIDASTGAVQRRLRGPFESIDDFAFLPERNAIAIAVRGFTLRPLVLWELGDEPVSPT